jgi:diguanylate cyclase (GGDEF)-like protein
MQIRDTKPVGGTAAVRTVETARRTTGGEAAGPTAPAAEPRETVSLAGIPEAELTPHVRQALLALMSEVHELRRQLDEAKGRIGYLERLADEDALIPIANRRAFVRELSRMMAVAQRYGTPASVIYFDLDGLKRINDTLGHAAGDAALQHCSRVLVESIRTSDFVGRLGGDEFGVILVQTDQETASKKAASLAETIAARPLVWQGQEIALSVSWGVHSFTGSEDVDGALDAADRAMYNNRKEARGE